MNVSRFPKANAYFWHYIPSFPGKAGKVFTWNGRKGLPSLRGISSLSSELTRTSTWDSEMEDVNWSMSARCSWRSSSIRENKQPGRGAKGRKKLLPMLQAAARTPHCFLEGQFFAPHRMPGCYLVVFYRDSDIHGDPSLQTQQHECLQWATKLNRPSVKECLSHPLYGKGFRRAVMSSSPYRKLLLFWEFAAEQQHATSP